MKWILHVDLNAFYASVEQALNPEIKGLPVAVAGDREKRNGIILTSSYEARAKGVKTAMTVSEAVKQCPELILIKPNLKNYLIYSNRVMDILKSFSPDVEVFSIDEAWIDVTGCEKLFGTPVEIAERIRSSIKKQLDITASVGVSYCKLIAKMASDMKKPDATTVILKSEIRDKIWPLPVEDLLGVGPKMKIKLNEIGIYFIGELANVPVNILQRKFGKMGTYLWYFANGIDNSIVMPQSCDVKGVGNSVTTPRDIKNFEEASEVIMALSESVGKRLREQHLKGNIIELTIRTKDFITYQRRRKLSYNTYITNDIYYEAVELLKENWDSRNAIRMLGVRVGGIVSSSEICQISFLDEREKIKNEKLDKCVDGIREKFGYNCLTRGALMVNDTSSMVNAISED